MPSTFPTSRKTAFSSRATTCGCRRKGPAARRLKYENLARDFGVELGGWSFGAQFGDLNNDGTLDLYLTNGYISLDRNRSYWYDFSKVAGGNSTIIGDARTGRRSTAAACAGYQSKRVWLNDGAGRFVDVAPAVGVTDTYDGRSVALADLWNRGVLDVVVANQNGPLLLYKNTVTPDKRHGSSSSWKAPPATAARSAPQVTLFWNGQQQVQEVSGGSGFAAQNQRRLHFGLGRNAAARKGGDSLAIGQGSDDRPACRRSGAQDQGAGMSDRQGVPSAALRARRHRAARADARRKSAGQSRQSATSRPRSSPAFCWSATCRSASSKARHKTLLAIVVSIALELVLGRIFYRKWLHPASAYITGISVGILIRSPAFWPYALCSAISITSKYVLRVKGRHLWNPSNFGISVMLFLAGDTVASLSIQWGNYLWPMLVIWVLGSLIIWRLQRFHITATYVVSFVVFACCEAGSPAAPGSPRSRRSPGRCTSSSSSS